MITTFILNALMPRGKRLSVLLSIKTSDQVNGAALTERIVDGEGAQPAQAEDANGKPPRLHPAQCRQEGQAQQCTDNGTACAQSFR